MSRKVQEEQMKLGEVDISELVFDPKSRDEIPQLLKGLQYIYCNIDLRKKVFELLEGHIPSKRNGRPGMDIWKILVLGTIRINCKWNYDKLKEIADNHNMIRKMIGHSEITDRREYNLKTLKDNLRLFTPELLQAINIIVVEAGQNIIKKKPGNIHGKWNINARCDSFVVETNVHFPTDINLLYDAVRKSVELTNKLCDRYSISGWRQANYLLKNLRKKLHHCEKIKRYVSKDPEKKKEEIKQAHKLYTERATGLIEKVKKSLNSISSNIKGSWITMIEIMVIEGYIKEANYQIGLVDRRVLQDEKIPHEEKIFSIFEKHTEWICKGKAGVPQELGIRVGIVEDRNGFILTHMIMEKSIDSKVAKELILNTKKSYPSLNSCSFDKGFWSKENQEELKTIIAVPAMSKKGRLSQADREREATDEFKEARKKHSAVESGINALENHGLDRCPDRGIRGFKSYVAFAVLARNIQKIGAELQKQEKESLKRSEAIKTALARKKAA